MTDTVDRLVEDYLDHLEQELADVPRARRRELVSEISDHIAEGRADARTEAEVRTLLDRLGEPAEIADEARERFGVPSRRERGRVLEVLALVLLLPGSLIVPLVGWLAGAIMLWLSPVWTLRDKLIGTLIVPGGLFLGLYVLLGMGVGEPNCVGVSDDTGYREEFCSGGATGIEELGITILIGFLLLGPLVSTAYLAWRIKRLSARVAA